MKKALSLIVSIGILCLLWAAFKTHVFNMENIKNLSNNQLVFWILWGIEAIVVTGWLWSELGYTHLSVNPVVYWALAWLAISVLLFVTGAKTAGMIMTAIAAVPLVIMAIFLIIIFLVNLFSGPIRWN